MGSTEVVRKTTEMIQQVRGRLQTMQSQQKSYADKHCLDLEFLVGDIVLLEVSPWKGVIRFGKCGKLGRIYVGPFMVLVWVGRVAYRLNIKEELSQIYSTFHVS